MENKIKKSIPILLIPIIIISTFSGCIEEQKMEGSNQNGLKNQPPVALFSVDNNIAPLQKYLDTYSVDILVYEDVIITFDAYDSYDPDGSITSYEWFFYDNTNSSQIEVAHKFNLDSQETKFPVIYTVTLQVRDNDNSYSSIEIKVGVFPIIQTYYFTDSIMTKEKPDSYKDKIKIHPSIIRDPTTIRYEFNKLVYIEKGGWNSTIYFEKSLLSILSNIELTVYNELDEEISHVKSPISIVLPKIFLGKNAVMINGIISESVEIGAIELQVSGFSIGRGITLLYGGEFASSISFYSSYDS